MTACKSDTDCGTKQRCLSDKCINVKCRADADCGENQGCRDYECYKKCTKDDECDKGYKCDNKLCVKPNNTMMYIIIIAVIIAIILGIMYLFSGGKDQKYRM